MKIFSKRYGHATNSSSTHSLVKIVPKSQLVEGKDLIEVPRLPDCDDDDGDNDYTNCPNCLCQGLYGNGDLYLNMSRVTNKQKEENYHIFYCEGEYSPDCDSFFARTVEDGDLFVYKLSDEVIKKLDLQKTPIKYPSHYEPVNQMVKMLEQHFPGRNFDTRVNGPEIRWTEWFGELNSNWLKTDGYLQFILLFDIYNPKKLCLRVFGKEACSAPLPNDTSWPQRQKIFEEMRVIARETGMCLSEEYNPTQD